MIFGRSMHIYTFLKPIKIELHGRLFSKYVDILWKVCGHTLIRQQASSTISPCFSLIFYLKNHSKSK